MKKIDLLKFGGGNLNKIIATSMRLKKSKKVINSNLNETGKK